MPAQPPAGVERLYVLYCGEGAAKDRSRWSPGFHAGEPITLTNSCYLIKHREGWMLWETGFNEVIASRPEGYPTPVIQWRWRASETLSQQLAEIGVKPEQISRLGFSHAHPDHIGNASLFPQATLYIQKAEYAYLFGPGAKAPTGPANYQKLRENKVQILEGDDDVFGDGSVTILSTPGHTPGHQSLMVRLPKTGTVILTGDAAHFRENFDQRRVPVQNFSKAQTLESMDKIARIAQENHAQLWINHDSEQTARLKMAPAYYD
jgi:glyoxylase-like metal-dependent hydrolase (beta-lactamase superfamily II)